MSKILKPGDKIPDLFLKDQDERMVSLRGYIGIQCLVVYFYPRDGTPGCTAEACSFRDRYKDFEALGARIIGISGDSTGSHKHFEEKYGLNFTLLSDPEHEAEKAFGVSRNFFGIIPGRVTFVFDLSGRLIAEYNSSIQATRHADEALKALKSVKVT